MRWLAVVLGVVLFACLPALVENSGWVGPAVSFLVLLGVVWALPSMLETSKR